MSSVDRFTAAFAALVACAMIATAVPSRAVAEETAVVRGVVFECDTHKVLAGVPVSLASPDGGTLRLRTDDHGRFVQLGMTPGSWAITASVPVPGKTFANAITRYATLRAGDVVDVPLGVFHDPLARADAKCQWPRVVVPDSPNLRYTL